MGLIQANNTTRRAAGFTLMEVILAMTVTAIVSAALFTSLSGAFKARRTAEDYLAGRETARMVMATLRADLQCVPPAGGRIRGVFRGEDETGMNNADTDSLSYVTANPALQSAQDLGDLRQVQLRLLESSSDPDHYVLARLVTGNLLATAAPQPEVQVLARRVVSLSLRYYDGGDWLEAWDSTEVENAIPAAVEVTLVIAPELARPPEDDDELELTYLTTTQIVRLPAAEEPSGDGIIDLLGF